MSQYSHTQIPSYPNQLREFQSLLYYQQIHHKKYLKPGNNRTSIFLDIIAINTHIFLPPNKYIRIVNLLLKFEKVFQISCVIPLNNRLINLKQH